MIVILRTLMKNNTIHILILFFLFGLHFSCTESKSKEYIKQATELIYSNTDSAQFLLNLINHPESLPLADYSDYILTRIKVHNRNSVSIKNDTAILKVIEYYNNTNNLKKLSEAYYMAGLVFEERDLPDSASIFYKKGIEVAEEINDNLLMGRGTYRYAELLEDEKKHAEAILWFQKSNQFFKNNNSLKLEINSLRKIADNYVLNNSVDTAVIIYQQYLENLPDRYAALKSHILKNMAVAYTKGNKFEKAKQTIRESIKEAPNNNLLSIQYLILSDIFKAQNQVDSANYYQAYAFKYGAELDDISILYFAYDTSMDHADKNDKFLESRYDYRLYRTSVDSIPQKQKFQTVRELQSLYNQEKLKRKNNELKIEKQRLFFGITSFILFAFILFLLYHLNRRKQIATLRNDLEKRGEIIDSTKSALVEKLNIYKKLTLWSISPQHEKYKRLLHECNKLIFDNDNEFIFNIETVSLLVDNIYDGFVSKLKNTFTQLNDLEIEICTLLKAGFTITEISSLLDKSNHTIYKYSSNIRKKISVPNNVHILDFIDHIYS